MPKPQIDGLDAQRSQIKSLEAKVAQLTKKLDAFYTVFEPTLKSLSTPDKKTAVIQATDAAKESATDTKDNNEQESTDNEASKMKPLNTSRVRWVNYSENYFGQVVLNDIAPPEESKQSKAQNKEAEDKNVKEEYAITWRQREKDEEEPIDLEINSSGLRKALKQVVRGYTDVSFDTEEVALKPPFAVIYHNAEGLRKYAAKDDTDEATKADIDILLHEVEKQQLATRKDISTLTKQGEISFGLLWSIFYPGCEVIRKSFLGEWQMGIVAPSTFDKSSFFPEPNSEEPLTLQLEYVDYKSPVNSFEMYVTEVKIDSFKGTKKIEDLEAFPLKWLGTSENSENGIDQNRASETQKQLKLKLVERGRRFEEICASATEKRFKEYSGEIMSEGYVGMISDDGGHEVSDSISAFSGEDMAKANRNNRKTASKTYVMIDHTAYLEYDQHPFKVGSEIGNSVCSCTTCNGLRLQTIRELPPPKPAKNGRRLELSDTQRLLCPPRLLGCVIKDKLWAQFKVTGIKDITEKGKEDAYNGLQINKDTKELLKDLVQQHSTNEKLIDDLIPGKGNGLIILLHGPPGVGKTLTAESLSMKCGKPLYSVTMSDVGTSASTVEKNMLRIFDLATQWKALLLFDEADIFLEKRELSDLRRNVLVSVLLRVLEYFQGILFLTSNRVKTFDEAFQSRIHVAVRFELLTERQRERIWKWWLDKYEDDIVDRQRFNSEFDDGILSSANLNGRQIRNVFSSAMAVARQKNAGKLTFDHVNSILKKTEEFQNYMMQNEEMARIKEIR